MVSCLTVFLFLPELCSVLYILCSISLWHFSFYSIYFTMHFLQLQKIEKSAVVCHLCNDFANIFHLLNILNFEWNSGHLEICCLISLLSPFLGSHTVFMINASTFYIQN